MYKSKMSVLFLVVSLFALLSIFLGTIACDSKATTEPNGDSTRKYSEVEQKSFAVGDSPILTVENFVGKVTVHAGSDGTIKVAATKWAPRKEDLELIEVKMTELESGVHIKTENPSSLENAAVDLDITAPTVTQPDLRIGVGDIDYQGRPHGSCRFETGVGSLRLRLPADIKVTVELGTGVGSIELGFSVDGQVSDQIVSGIIGSGDEGDIHALTGVGDIDLIRQ